MSDALSYEDEFGNTIFTSEFYKRRGSCCKSGCLHCPYGYTLNKIGIKLNAINSKNKRIAKSFFDKYINKSNFASSLLEGAFGAQKSAWDEKNFLLLTLKDRVCGLLEVDKKGEYKSHYLHPMFKDQGINDTYLRSLL